MKVLIVDDDHISRKLLQKIIAEIAETETVDSGSTAIAVFKKALEKPDPFDVVTLDITMPVLDGKAVLAELRKIELAKKIAKEKQAKIIMVTAHSEKDMIIACVKMGCNDYITKPFDKDMIFKKFKTLGLKASGPQTTAKSDEPSSIKETIQSILKRFRESGLQLPVLPNILEDIKQVMRDPTATIEDLSKIIAQDATLSLKLIATANSPAYRGAEKIESVNMAIQRVGFKETQSIVTTIANRSLYKAKHKQFDKLMENLWYHSLACAIGARAVAVHLKHPDPEKIFLMGLIHDIGKALLLRALDDISPAQKIFDTNELLPVLQEAHAQFGASLLKGWGFQDEFVQIALLHEGPEFTPATAKEILIVHLASNLARRIGYSVFDTEVDLANLSSARLLRVSPGILTTMTDDMKKQINALGTAF